MLMSLSRKGYICLARPRPSQIPHPLKPTPNPPASVTPLLQGYPGETILVEKDKHPFRTTVLQKTRTETKDPTDLAA